MNSSKQPIEPPLVRDGGIARPPCGTRDPYEALDDLMAVVEVLCPVWPERRTFAESTDYRI